MRKASACDCFESPARRLPSCGSHMSYWLAEHVCPERERLIGSVKTVIGGQEWHRRLEEVEDGGVLTVLGLYHGEGEREREAVISYVKEFLVKAWGIRE